jgi:hypothetical protein
MAKHPVYTPAKEERAAIDKGRADSNVASM